MGLGVGKNSSLRPNRPAPMSFPVPAPQSIPADTARAAKAAFPKGNPYIQLRDELGPVYVDTDFADLYPNRGQPALQPGRLALVVALQVDLSVLSTGSRCGTKSNRLEVLPRSGAYRSGL